MKYDPEIFEDIMGLVIETDCPFLNKKLNNHICYKGGGGGQTTTTTASIPAELKGIVTNIATKTGSALDDGTLAQVAETDPLITQGQEEVLAQKEALSSLSGNVAGTVSDQATGEGLFSQGGGTGSLEGLKSAYTQEAGQRLSGMRASDMVGNRPGSSLRAEMRAGGVEGALAGKLAELDFKDMQERRKYAAGAAGSLAATQQGLLSPGQVTANVGKERQVQTQKEMDALFENIKRASDIIYGNPMAKGTTTTTTGGGK